MMADLTREDGEQVLLIIFAVSFRPWYPGMRVCIVLWTIQACRV